MPDLAELCGDLEAEHRELDAMVGGSTRTVGARPPRHRGGTIRDQFAHLAFVEGRAALALESHDAFAAALADDRADAERFAYRMGGGELPADGASTLAAWRATAARFVALARASDPAERVPWYGPPMRPASMVSARIMETWAHAEDVAEALGSPHPPTSRLRHIAHLGVGSRRWSYAVNQLEHDDTPVYVELVGPDDDTWTWGDPAAPSSVRGPALDFCRVVTRRRLPDDTALTIQGPAASGWLAVAQAFAGPPGPPPRRR